MIVLEHEQGTSEWFRARAGRPTASRFGDVLTQKTLKMSTGKAAKSYLATLVAERLLEGPIEMGSSAWAERGHYMEHIARSWYALEREIEVRRVGLVTTDDGRWAGSPDGLVDDDPEGPGGLEIKALSAREHVAILLGGDIPNDLQSQGLMNVTGRAWWDVLCYNPEPALPHALIRRRRNPHIQERLDDALGSFVEAVDKAEQRVRDMGSRGRQEDGLAELLQWSLVHGKDEDPDRLTMDDIDKLRLDLSEAVRLGVFDASDRDAVLEAAVAGQWSQVRQLWEYLHRASELKRASA